MFYLIALLLLLSSEPSTLLQEANSAFDQNSFQEAVPKFEQAIALLNPQTNQKEIAEASYKLGVSYLRTGRYQDSTELLQKALVIHDQLGDKENTGFDLTILGYAYVNLSKYDEALQTEETALKIHESIGNRKGIAMTLRGIGLVHYYRGNYEPALDFFQRG